MLEPRMFRSVYGYQATFHLTTNGSWVLKIDHFYEGEPWSIDDRSVYESLSLLECHQVLLEEISRVRL